MVLPVLFIHVEFQGDLVVGRLQFLALSRDMLGGKMCGYATAKQKQNGMNLKRLPLIQHTLYPQ